ncbi:Sucrase/ferredoxin-like-domain-containing protein [Jimgerdemannia flammicorona]|uniref:Sucrase/ferredoxin-like-domain-containing protein n=1 Tax=Jimgerdemannia flammicorona TaxID=994334 RepID=A0A433QZU0_9FUNG|nr:Sucrase/ferredoxin-like-domain-containing protein [Jimgerdemannia flammicorona]
MATHTATSNPQTLPPFDIDLPPLDRFSPCCDAASCSAAKPNGFIPCKRHPIPGVIGAMIDLADAMAISKTYRRHLVACVGEDAPEWMRAKVEAAEGGVIEAVQKVKREWMLSEHERGEGEATRRGEGEVIIHSKKSDENAIKALVDEFKTSSVGSKEGLDSQMASSHEATNSGDNLFVTACDRIRSERNPTTTTWPTSDILLFPDFKLYYDIEPHLTIPSKPSTFSILMSSLNPSTSQAPAFLPHRDLRPTTHAVVLVCTHTRRDKRCGVLGPLIIQEFKRVLAKKEVLGCRGTEVVEDEGEGAERARELTGGKVVEVFGTSHVGGHKFAGNVIIHTPTLGGHMYGNVRPCHVEAIIDRHVLGGRVVRSLWRGQVCAPAVADPGGQAKL